MSFLEIASRTNYWWGNRVSRNVILHMYIFILGSPCNYTPSSNHYVFCSSFLKETKNWLSIFESENFGIPFFYEKKTYLRPRNLKIKLVLQKIVKIVHDWSGRLETVSCPQIMEILGNICFSDILQQTVYGCPWTVMRLWPLLPTKHKADYAGPKLFLGG